MVIIINAKNLREITVIILVNNIKQRIYDHRQYLTYTAIN